MANNNNKKKLAFGSPLVNVVAYVFLNVLSLGVAIVGSSLVSL